GGQQIVPTTAGENNRQTQQSAQVFRYARRHGILLMQRREIDRAGLVEQQRGQQLFLRRREAGQIEVTYQIRGVLRRGFEIDAEADFVQLTGADQQIARQRLQIPDAFHLLGKTGGQLGDAQSLLGIDHETALNVT